MTRILHIAPFNTANVPHTFMQTERKLGFDSRLITFGKNSFGFSEDICLNLPFLKTPGISIIKKIISPDDRLQVENVHNIPGSIPKIWRTNGILESKFIRFREWIWKKEIRQALLQVDVANIDVLQLDGGLEFYRNGRIVKRLKEAGKKIICCYTGSDLRIRGVIPEVDESSDLNVSVEFDHLLFHPNVHHIFFPFDVSPFRKSKRHSTGQLRIGHAPTNRQAKGSDRIISELKKLQAYHSLEIVLIENMPHKEALKLKSTCDIFIDQIGDLGYGINSLEAFAMEIPVASSLVRNFSSYYPDHPFIEISGETLAAKLQQLIGNSELRRKLGQRGRRWVKKYHDPEKVVKKIHELAGINVTENKIEE